MRSSRTATQVAGTSRTSNVRMTPLRKTKLASAAPASARWIAAGLTTPAAASTPLRRRNCRRVVADMDTPP
jgi:hypothetical protein